MTSIVTIQNQLWIRFKFGENFAYFSNSRHYYALFIDTNMKY